MPAGEGADPLIGDVSACIMDLPHIRVNLQDIIEVPKIQSLIDDFYKLTNIGLAIVDLEDNILVSVGWQEICSKFHRVHEITKANCMESDRYLTQNVKDGKFLAYRCKNNMWEVVTPIYVGGKHMGNLFIGQFFFDDEPIDIDLFNGNAERYGFEKGAYLTALSQVPRISRERVNDLMNFNVKLTSLISLLGYCNLRLINDNNERKVIEKAFREKENVIDRILSADPNGILICDIDNDQIVYRNPRSIELLGHLPEDMRSISDVIKARVYSEDTWKIDKAISEMRDLKDYETNETEIRLLNHMDQWIWAHLYLVPFTRNENGGLTQILLVMQEVTERIMAEKEMSLQLEEIFRTNELLTETTRELSKSENALRKANDQLNIMNTITRHDAMNQLMVIQGFATLLEGGDLPPKYADYVKKMTRSVQAIQEQLEFVKIYQDIGVKAPTWQNLNDCVQNAKRTLTLKDMELREKNLDIWILADPMLPKVIFNLLENAVRHSGGAKLMTVSAEEAGNVLKIVFEDNGSGITPEDKVHLFERGFGKHTGLGLFLIREILNISNIQIVENSEPGKGARFEISVPSGSWCSN
ncbi:MAG TPA: PocR ligand-binding domain-containing protein [Methanomassiliicoccales archaeon]